MTGFEKLSKEIADNKDNKYIKMIGDYLLNLLKESQTLEVKILIEGKTIKGGIKAMQAVAKKQAVNNMAMLTDEEGYKIIRKYFGITEEKSGLDISLGDLL